MEYTALMKNNMVSLHEVSLELEEFLNAAHLSGRTACNVSLAFEEMATNVIKYSYDDPGEHVLDIRIQIEETRVVMTLIDDGHEFDPTRCPEPDVNQGIMERPVGGLGIYLTARLSESMKYVRKNGKNMLIITVRK